MDRSAHLYGNVKMYETLTPAQRQANRDSAKAERLIAQIAQLREWAADSSLGANVQAMHAARAAKFEAELMELAG
jgi:hypothetical protein